MYFWCILKVVYEHQVNVFFSSKDWLLSYVMEHQLFFLCLFRDQSFLIFIFMFDDFVDNFYSLCYFELTDMEKNRYGRFF